MTHQNHDFLKGPHKWENGSYVAMEPAAAEMAEESTGTAEQTETAQGAETAAEAKTEPQAGKPAHHQYAQINTK